MREQRTPTKITLDAYAASHRAVADPKTTGELPKRVKVRSSKSEQHHRTGSPAREASTWPDAGTEEFPNGGGGDWRSRIGREDQERAIQDWQVGRDYSNHAGNLASSLGCVIGSIIQSTRQTRTDRHFFRICTRTRPWKHSFAVIGAAPPEASAWTEQVHSAVPAVGDVAPMEFYVVGVSALVALFNQMKASIKKFDDAIEEISQQHPCWTIANSLPGRRSGHDRSAVSRPGERSPLRNCVSDAMRHRD